MLGVITVGDEVVQFPLSYEPTLQDIANLTPSGYAMIVATLLLQTGCNKNFSTVDALFEVYNRLSDTYNPKVAKMSREYFSTSLYDMWRNDQVCAVAQD